MINFGFLFFYETLLNSKDYQTNIFVSFELSTCWFSFDTKVMKWHVLLFNMFWSFKKCAHSVIRIKIRIIINYQNVYLMKLPVFKYNKTCWPADMLWRSQTTSYLRFHVKCKWKLKPTIISKLIAHIVVGVYMSVSPWVLWVDAIIH